MGIYALTFLVGFAGSLLSGMAGAGSGLIISPYLLLIGLPPHITVATGKVGGLGLDIGSLTRFYKSKHIRWELMPPFLAVSIASALLGSQLLLALNESVVRVIVVAAVLMALPILTVRKMGTERRATSPRLRAFGYGVKFCVELAQSAFGSGLGVLNSITTMLFFGTTAIESNATRNLPGLVKLIIVVPIFAFAGIVAWQHGVALLLGSVLGGYTGAHFAILKGNKFVKILFVAVVLAMTLKLVLF